MITDLEYVASNGIILQGKIDKVSFQILFSDIFPFWNYATEEDLEGGGAYIRGNRVLFTMVTANTQGGIVVLWNVETNSIEHISEAGYCVACDMDAEKIYLLRYVYNYVTKANLQLWEVSRGVKDPGCTGTRLSVRQFPEVTAMDLDTSNCAIHKTREGFEIYVLELPGFFVVPESI